MAYGEPKDVEGQCNARLAIADNYGDNHTTIVCQLPLGHDAPHCEKYNSRDSGQVTITWERHDTSYDVEALERELEESIQLECGWDSTEKDYDWVNEAGESLPSESEEKGLSATVWTMGGNRISYSVLGKNAVRIGSTTFTKAEALRQIFTALRGETP